MAAEQHPRDSYPIDTPHRGARWQLRDEASSYIRSLILSRQLSPGTYLRLGNLARQFGMSVTPVREAMMSLREQGFVELVPRHGFRVLQIAPADVADLFLVQSFAAGELAARTSQLATDELIASLEALDDQLRRLAEEGNGRGVEVVNDEFHELINASSNSPSLARFYASAIPIIPRRFLSLVPGWTEASLEDHRRVVECIRERDRDKSRQAMSDHILRVGQLVADHLRAGGSWPGAQDSMPGSAGGPNPGRVAPSQVAPESTDA
jgi:DNA-binding GntR family transcriptional regulator